MTFIPSPDAARVCIRFSQGGQEFSNNFHFTKANFTNTDLDNLAVGVDGVMPDNYLQYITSDVTYVRTDAYDIRSLTGNVYRCSDSSAAGDLSYSVLPISVAAVVTLRTATRGRAGRGRIYVAGFSEEDILDGIWGAAVDDIALLYVNAVVGAATALGWTFCIRSTQLDGVQLEEAVMRPVTLIEWRNGIPGTQRRRLDRG